MKPIVPAAAALVLAACASSPQVPPQAARNSAAAAPMHHVEARSTTRAKPLQGPARAAEVKPLGRGILTAENVENYMDAQEKDLRVALRGTGTVVSRMGDNLAILLPDSALFSGDSQMFSNKGQAILIRIAADVRRYDSTRVSVSAFTDARGTPAQAKRESESRAQAVKNALAANGVDLRRMEAKGLGSENARIPTAGNGAEPRNRRVEIEISPVMKG